MSLPGTDASVASATTVWISSNRIALRATAITGVPLSARTWAIPRPRPRDAPTTMLVLSERSLSVMALCRQRVRLRLDEQRVPALEQHCVTCDRLGRHGDVSFSCVVRDSLFPTSNGERLGS